MPPIKGLTFPTAASYAEYVSHFHFQGVSFSGGEPLLYTNGILGTPAIFKELANSG